MDYQRFINYLAITSTALFSANSHAAFVNPSTWARGDDYSMYFEWDKFDSATLATKPDIGTTNTGATTLKELAGASFLTSAGNIYSFAAAQSFLLSVAGDNNAPSVLADSVDVHLQIRTLGTPLNTDSVRLNGLTGNASLLSRENVQGGFGGAIEEYLITWSILPTHLYVMEFAAQESSMSLDALAFDAFGAPDTVAISIPPLPPLPPFPWPPGNPDFNVSQIKGQVNVSAVPIPGGLVLFSSALITLLWPRRSKR